MARGRQRARQRQITKAVSPGFAALAEVSRETGSEMRARPFALLEAIQAATGEMYGAGQFQPLDRDPRNDSAFGPMDPLSPEAIDPLNAVGRTDPRVWQYQVGWNLPGNGNREVPWQVLRAAADGVGVMRRCIEVRKKHVRSLRWNFSISEDAIKDAHLADPRRGRLDVERELRDRLMPEIKRLREFWRKPWKGNDADMGQWINAIMEDYLVLDAVAVFPRLTYGGDVHDFEILDSTTIKPLLDNRGARPIPPFPAFQQILYGFPRGEWMASAEYDEEGNALVSDTYADSELFYRRENFRSSSPYGFSPTEMALYDARLYLQRQKWMLAEYDDGSTPLTWVETAMPEDGQRMTLTQQRDWEKAYNAKVQGQTRERHRIKVMPNGWKATQMTSVDERYKPEYDLHLIKLLASYYGVPIAELGFTEPTGLGNNSWHEGQAEVSGRLGLRPDTAVITDVINTLSRQFLKMPTELEGAFVDPSAANTAERETVIAGQRARGSITLNEERAELGQSLLDFDEADMYFMATATGPIFIQGSYERVQQAAEASKMQAQAQVDGTAGKLAIEHKRLEDGAAAREEGRDFAREQFAAQQEADVNKAAEISAYRNWNRKHPEEEPRRPFLFKHVTPDDGFPELENIGPWRVSYEGWEWFVDDDITKSVMSYLEWNLRHPNHPRGPNGRWVKVDKTQQGLPEAIADQTKKDVKREQTDPIRRSTKPIVENRGEFIHAKPGSIAYHPHGQIGYAIQYMGDDKNIEVEGDALANVLGRTLTDSVAGRITPRQELDRLKEITAQVPSGTKARTVLDEAIRTLDAPNVSAPDLPERTPKPLRQLIAELADMPQMHNESARRREGGTELDQAVNLAERWNAGELHRLELRRGMDALINRRHESEEGKFSIDRATRKASNDLQAIYRDLVQPEKTEARVDLTPDQRKALERMRPSHLPDAPDDLAFQAQVRQAKLDVLRDRAEIMQELEELHFINQGSLHVQSQRFEAHVKRGELEGDPHVSRLREAIASGDSERIDDALTRAERELGLERVGGDRWLGPDQMVPFDPKLHKPIGKRPISGEFAYVVRPGYYAKVDGERVLVLKAGVSKADPAEVARFKELSGLGGGVGPKVPGPVRAPSAPSTRVPKPRKQQERMTAVEIRDAVRSGVLAEHKPTHGEHAETAIIRTASGHTLVRKRIVGSTLDKDIERQFDAEDLASRLGRAVGALVPNVYADRDNNTIYMEYMSGRIPWQAPKERIAAAVNSPMGRRLGLLDHMLQNNDRNRSNWLLTRSNEPIGIDHAFAFKGNGRGPELYPMFHDARAEGHVTPAFGSFTDEFSRQWADQSHPLGKDRWGFERTRAGWETLLTREELEAIRERIKLTRPHFEQADRMTWYQNAIEVINGVIYDAKDTLTKATEPDPAQQPPVPPEQQPPVPPDPRWPGWLLDALIAAAVTALLIKALPDLNFSDLLARFGEWSKAYRPGDPMPDVRQWITREQPELQNRLEAILRGPIQQAHIEGALVGQRGAEALIEAVLRGDDPREMHDGYDIDWSGWTPGHRSAAEMLLEPNGLERLLYQSNVSIKSIANNRLEQVGRILGEGLARGDTPEAIARTLRERMIDNRAWAHRIAVTETNRAMSYASVMSYRDAGMAYKGWMTAFDQTVCPICLHNEFEAPGIPRVVPIDELFPSGDPWPPAHPHCRCASIPVVGFPRGITKGAMHAVMSWLEWNTKHPEHPRMHAGRFTVHPDSDTKISTKVTGRAKVKLHARDFVPHVTPEEFDHYTKADVIPPEHVVAKLEQVFSGVYGDFHIDPHRLTIRYSDHNEISVRGIITDKNGEALGSFERVLREDPDGKVWAHHEFLKINDKDLRGQGFAQAFNARLEAFYRDIGVSGIKLNANIDIGGYAWARHGFDFDGDAARKHVLGKLQALADLLESDSGAGKKIPNRAAQVVLARKMIKRMKGDPTRDDYPTPFEISQLGRWRGAGRDDVWVGKAALLGSNWDGVKYLD